LLLVFTGCEARHLREQAAYRNICKTF
jgi:hypothetical protein